MRRPFSWPSRLAMLALVVCLPLQAIADDVDEDMAARQIDQLIDGKLEGGLTAIWKLSEQMFDLGRSAIPSLREKMPEAKPPQCLAMARALVLLDDSTRGMDALRKLAFDKAVKTELREAALVVIGREGEPEEAEWLEERVEVELEPRVKLSIAKALWEINRNAKSKAKGKEVMLAFMRSSDDELRALGALALGEIGAGTEAKRELRMLAMEPTERGRSAALLLKVLQLERVLEQDLRSDEGDGPDPAPTSSQPATNSAWPLLDEIYETLRRSYVSADKIDRRKLEDAAALGLTKALDPHTNYLTPEENAKLQAALDPSYGGIGAYVQNDPNNGERFTISRPIYGGPVYRADLRAGDVILRIGDESTEGLAVDDCVRLLKGPPGTRVEVTIARTGWTEPKAFTLTRARIVIPSTAYDVLPGNIGFLQIQHFSDATAEEVGKVLDEFERKRVSGLIIDLRSNSGGYLKSAVEIASNFVERGLPVVSEVGRPGVWPRRTHRSDGRGTHRRNLAAAPIVVLVNSFTASAAEILSGALKDYERARLVGDMTFGKGSAQIPIDLRTRPGEPFVDVARPTRYYRGDPFTDLNGNRRWDPGEPYQSHPRKNGRFDEAERFEDANANGVYDPGETFTDANGNGVWDDREPFTDTNGNGKRDPSGTMKTTIARYETPSGFNPNGKFKVVNRRLRRVGGIEPHVTVRRANLDLWEVQVQRKLESDGHVRKYVERIFQEDRAAMERLARSDRGDPSQYPGFDTFYESLDTRLSKGAVRWLVRFHVRRELGDALGRELVGDVVDDRVLQAAVRDLLRTLDVQLADVPDLAFLASMEDPAEVDRKKEAALKKGDEEKDDEEKDD